MTTWYFAYGSNMNPARMQARNIDFRQALPGRLQHYQLRFNKRAVGKQGVAYANVAYKKNAVVEGVVYQLKSPRHISDLDPYEGTPVRYSREIFAIDLPVRKVVHAWVYVANPAMIDTGILPEQRYMDHLLAGRNWHSESYHQWLKTHAFIEQEPLSNTDEGLAYNV